MRLLILTMLLLTTLILSGCKLTLLNPKGMIAADEKTIMITAVVLMLIVVIPVIVLTLIFAWRYRASNIKANYQPEWSHNTLIEIICWTIPCVIIAMLGTITWISSHRLDPFNPLENQAEEPIVIQAIALEWKWLFIYPDQHIATVNYLQLPVHTPVKFYITAEGPMNSFQIPALGGQIYAMAGMQAILHLVADQAGDYNGFSSQFSGEGFSDMTFIAHVGTKDEFNQWVTRVQKSQDTLSSAEYQKLVQPSIKHPVKYYSLANRALFENVVMKAMVPLDDAKNLCNTKLQGFQS